MWGARAAWGQTANPKNWKIFGSNDGSTWVLVDTQTNVTWATNPSSNTFLVSSSTAYSYYRCVVTALTGNDYCMIGQLIYYGY